ncbi:MAG TPA: MFS transporter, partial [Hyphomicrobiales bacterium]|nr:MFS transporter [Hyphomicrobiales bacterium]
MTDAAAGTAISPTPAKPARLRALGSACLAHILHDGYTDLLYLLLPIWQREFGLSFALVGIMKTLFSGALSLFQIPLAKLASYIGERAVLSGGTLLIAGAVFCYAFAGSAAVL